MQNEDPAAVRVKPMPIQVVHHGQSRVSSGDAAQQTHLDTIYVGFFYMLRPGEYMETRNNKPILLQNITLKTEHDAFQAATATLRDIKRATYTAITFDDQKNRRKGETIAHGQTGHPVACPVEAIKRLVLQLRRAKVSLNTPRCTYFNKAGKACTVKSTTITKMLRNAVQHVPELGYETTDVSSRSLRAGGAMALLLGGVDKDTIKLVGRWRSDAVFEYLHAQTLPLIQPLAAMMLEHGTYTLISGGITPEQAERLLAQVPPQPGQPYYLEIAPEDDDMEDAV